MGRFALVLLGCGISATACVDERAFYISRNVSPCGGGGSAAESLGSGVLDVQGQQGYVFFPELVSELVATSGSDGEPERNRLTLRGFEVDVDLGQVAANLGLASTVVSSTEPVFATLEPGGKVITSVTLITAELVQQLKGLPVDRRPWVVARMRAVADHSGSTLKSAELEYPVQLCNGCLMSGVVPGSPLPDCPSERPAQAKSNTCGLPQDSEVFCCGRTAPRCLNAADLTALPEPV